MSLQRVLEAEENGDAFQDDEEFELDAPKRKNRNRNKVSGLFGTRGGRLCRRLSRLLCHGDVVFQNRGSSRRRTEAVSSEEQDKPYVCDSKRTRGPRVQLLAVLSVFLDDREVSDPRLSSPAVFMS